MRFLLVLFLILVPRICFSQVEISTESLVSENHPLNLVRISGQPIALMCEGFVKEFGFNPANGMISIKPKTFPSGQEEMMGEVWVVMLGNKEIEVERQDLPPPLNRFRGVIARRILRGTCYTRESSFFGLGDLSFITANFTEAQMLAKTLRGE